MTARALRSPRSAQLTGGMSPQAFGGAWFNVLVAPGTRPVARQSWRGSLVQKSVAMAQFAGRLRSGERTRGAASGGFALRAALRRPRVEQVSFQPDRTVVPDDRRTWRARPCRTCRARTPSAEGLRGFHACAKDSSCLRRTTTCRPTRSWSNRRCSEHGRNLLRGVSHLAEDVQRTLQGPRSGRHRAVPGRASRSRVRRAR